MIGMQYKITLPNNYDMQIIRDRVKNNGFKTDSFPDLEFKLYLITEKSKYGDTENTYAPLYFWKNHTGMNHFIFGGFYDGILDSFGWQQIHIGVPLFIHLEAHALKNARYITESIGILAEEKSIKNYPLQLQNHLPTIKDSLGYFCVYNPDKWSYSIFELLENVPSDLAVDHVYEILHVSQPRSV